MCAPSLTHPTSLLHTSSPPSHSIQTLVKISKTAGARLKPHAPRLIPALLEALSTLEPAVLNYLSLRATEQEKVTPPLEPHLVGSHVGAAPGVSPSLSLCSLSRVPWMRPGSALPSPLL